MKWINKDIPDNSKIAHLSEAINVNRQLATLLIQRGIETFDQAKEFFRPSLDSLHDPFLMKDMDKAVERLSDAISEGEKIMIYGDYDVDGTTAVSTVFGFLSTIYDNLIHYIPDRYSEGYGVSTKGIDTAIDQGVSLIISLDCGIKAIDKITYAKENGIDFIVCDHHRPGPQLPPAVAILDPKQDGCGYPYKELCGCGVGFKFLHAFCTQNTLDDEDLLPFLDLVAVATCSDIVPLTGENRTLVYYGLKQLNKNPRPGLLALINIAGFKTDLTVSNVVFGLGPRINAAGRIEHAKGAVEMLLAQDLNEAQEIAELINEHNLTRREFDQSITAEAISMIESNDKLAKAKSTVLYKEDWHKGVIGIVASRCIETYYRPTIILTRSNGKAAGSARSVEGYDVYEAISACADLLEQFGGHTYAAGLTMEVEKIEAFQEKFESVVSKSITEDQLIQKIIVDLELELEEITPKFYKILKQMGPFGPQNMQPVFVTKGVTSTANSRIVKQDHLKLSVKKGDSNVVDGIAFGMANHYEHISSGKPFDLCYTIEENTFNGVTNLQLMVKDIKY